MYLLWRVYYSSPKRGTLLSDFRDIHQASRTCPFPSSGQHVRITLRIHHASRGNMPDQDLTSEGNLPDMICRTSVRKLASTWDLTRFPSIGLYDSSKWDERRKFQSGQTPYSRKCPAGRESPGFSHFSMSRFPYSKILSCIHGRMKVFETQISILIWDGKRARFPLSDWAGFRLFFSKMRYDNQKCALYSTKTNHVSNFVDSVNFRLTKLIIIHSMPKSKSFLKYSTKLNFY